MERRLIVAILLMIAVAVVPSLFLKPAHRPGAPPADTTHAGGVPADTQIVRPTPAPPLRAAPSVVSS